MSGQQAAKRRRSQAKNGYAHMPPAVRPHYKKIAAAASARRLAAFLEKQKRMMAGKNKRSKK